MMRTNKFFVIVALLLVASASLAQDAPTTAALQCFSESWNSHDMKAFGRCFAADADFVNVTTQWWKGRTNLEKNHAYMHGTVNIADRDGITVPQGAHAIFKTTTFIFTSSDTRYLTDDVALVHAAWQISGDVRTAELRMGLMTLVLVRKDGAWQIAAVQNTESNRNVR
jgi:ketosteroid isomerase-like protein